MRRSSRSGGLLTGVVVWRCDRCGRRSFPRRELCPFCASSDVAPEQVERGVATEVTSHRGVGVACVRVDPDVTLLTRAAAGIEAGAAVELELDGAAAVAKRA